MSLREKISSGQKEALVNHDNARLQTLRMLWSAIRNEEIEKRTEDGGMLTDEEIQKVVARQIKQLNDAMKDYETGGRLDLIETSKKEIHLLKEFMPEEMSDEEINKIIKKIIDEQKLTGGVNVGKIIGLAMKEIGGRADGNKVRVIVTKNLES